MTISQRNSIIDITKGIGITLVVFGHNWIVLHEKGELFRVIFSFHMPLFFILSGVFLKTSNPISEIISKRFQSLIKPFLAVSLFAITLPFTINFINGKENTSSYTLQLIKIFYGTGETVPWTPLWFLPNLFLTIIFAYFLINLTKKKGVSKLVLLSIFMLSMGYLINCNIRSISLIFRGREINGSIGLPWSIDLLPITCSFVLLGYIVRDKIINISNNYVLAIISASSFFLLHFLYDETIDLNFRIYGNLFISTAQAILGTCICICLAAFIEKINIVSKILSYLGSISLFILMFHGYIQSSSFELLSKKINSLYLCGILSFVFGLVLPVIIYEISKRIMILRLLLISSTKK